MKAIWKNINHNERKCKAIDKAVLLGAFLTKKTELPYFFFSIDLSFIFNKIEI